MLIRRFGVALLAVSIATSAFALNTKELLSLVAMPLAVAAASDLNGVREPAYNVTNLRATWIWPGENVRVSVIGNNVFDTKYNQAMAIATAGTRGVIARPASIAGELRVDF